MNLPVHAYNEAHRIYNKDVERMLDRLWIQTLQGGWTSSETRKALFQMTQEIRSTIWKTGKLVAR